MDNLLRDVLELPINSVYVVIIYNLQYQREMGSYLSPPPSQPSDGTV